jgi:hypothetical protein
MIFAGTQDWKPCLPDFEADGQSNIICPSFYPELL